MRGRVRARVMVRARGGDLQAAAAHAVAHRVHSDACGEGGGRRARVLVQRDAHLVRVSFRGRGRFRVRVSVRVSANPNPNPKPKPSTKPYPKP